ncbi:MAG: hypothetical protein AAF715_32575 [Myxococcota bacterium]
MFGGFAPLPLRLTNEDPRESWSAGQHARACSDLRHQLLSAPLALVRYQSAAEPTILAYVGQDGKGSRPTITHNGNGDDTLTWPAAAEDAFGGVEAFAISHAVGTVVTANAPIGFSPAGWVANVEVVTSREVRVRTYFFANGQARNRAVFLAVF